MADAKPLARPVNYKHPYGAVIWVNLEPDVAAAVAAQGGVGEEAPQRPLVAPPQAAPALAQSDQTAPEDRRVVTITGGNLRNSHICLPLEFFPADAIGGKNRNEAAPVR